MLTVATSHIIPNVNRAQFSAQYNPGAHEHSDLFMAVFKYGYYDPY
jgi:hypothetical protein